MKHKPQPEYLIRLRGLPDQVPAPIRLRRAVKCLLRSFGFRALSIEPAIVEPAAPASDQGDGRAGVPDRME